MGEEERAHSVVLYVLSGTLVRTTGQSIAWGCLARCPRNSAAVGCCGMCMYVLRGHGYTGQDETETIRDTARGN